MTKWEYKIYDDCDFDENSLNRLGRLGWELVNLTLIPNKLYNKIYIFKRELI